MSTPKFYETADCRLTLGSMSAALRAQRALQRVGISGSVIKSASNQRNSGCVYGIAVPCARYESAKQTLRDQGITVSPAET